MDDPKAGMQRKKFRGFHRLWMYYYACLGFYHRYGFILGAFKQLPITKN